MVSRLGSKGLDLLTYLRSARWAIEKRCDNERDAILAGEKETAKILRSRLELISATTPDQVAQ
jgi:hypothetical protein